MKQKRSNPHKSTSGLSAETEGTGAGDDYEIPRTPNVTPEDSLEDLSIDSCLRTNGKIVVLTRVTRYLPCHILNVLLSKEYMVRGVVMNADRQDDMETLFSIHSSARKLLFLQHVSPLNQKHWEKAFTNAHFVIHVVVPISTRTDDEKGDDYGPTVDVMKKIISACVSVKSVRRLVLVTSVASIGWCTEKSGTSSHFTEDRWESESNLTGYARCQLECEKIAWSIVNCLPEEDKIELVVLNPSYVLGPIIQGRSTNTIAVIKRIMEHKFDTLPMSSIPVVDVRDVAQAAAVALRMPEAVGQRHILYGGTAWIEDIAFILHSEFHKQGYNVLTKTKTETKSHSCWPFKSKVQVQPSEGRLTSRTSGCITYDNTRMCQVLGIVPHAVEETVIETAYSLIHYNMVRKDIVPTKQPCCPLPCDDGRQSRRKNSF